MPRKWGDDAVAGSFEELPVLLVVLVTISLFSVSVAHAAMSRAANEDYQSLRDECLTFAGMVRSSETLGASDRPGIYDYGILANLSAGNFLEEFNATLLGFEYRVSIQCLDLDTGNVLLSAEILSSETPGDAEIASYHTCMNVDYGGQVGAARLVISIWRPAE